MIALLITGALLLAGIAIWAARGDYYDEQEPR